MKFIICEYKDDAVKSMDAYIKDNLRLNLVSYYQFDDCPRKLKAKINELEKTTRRG